MRELREEDNLPAGGKPLARYLKPDLLIVDDMGLKQLPPRSGEYLFEIIMRRYENRSTLMTSNRPVEEWGKLVGDVPAASGDAPAAVPRGRPAPPRRKPRARKERASRWLTPRPVRAGRGRSSRSRGRTRRWCGRRRSGPSAPR